MNPRFESVGSEPLPPRVNIIEENPDSHKVRDRSFNAIPDTLIKNPENMSLGERNDEFKKAYDAIVGNEGLEELTIRGIKGNFNAFSELTNKITETCISLSDTEIDDIVRKFKEALRKKADSYASKFDLSIEESLHLKKDVREISETKRKFTIDPIGIKSVAHFVRARKKLHALEPKIIPSFYFENYLDAKHKIDLVEVIEGDEGAILNLIQIKSNEYRPGDIEDISAAHKEWVDGFTLDLAAYERNFSVEPEDSPEMKEFLTNVGNVQDVFVDLLTGDEVPSKQLLFEKLGIGTRPKVEQVWILNEYLPLVMDVVLQLKDEGMIEDTHYAQLQPLFDDMQGQLDVVRLQKKDLAGISEIHSICAVNDREVSNTIIFEGRGDRRKSIKIEYPIH